MTTKRSIIDLMRAVNPSTTMLVFRTRLANVLMDMRDIPEEERCAPEDMQVEWNFGFNVADNMTVGEVLARLNN